MDLIDQVRTDDEFDPLEAAEHVLIAEQKTFERSEDEIHFAASTEWTDLHGVFSWRAEFPAMVLTLAVDMKTPKARRADVAALVALLNETLWLGHFDLWSEDGSVVYRATLPVLGRDGPEPVECAALLAAGVEAVERFYPAFNFLVWAGKTPEEAAGAVLFETLGQA